MADRELKVKDETSTLTQVAFYHSYRKEIGTLSNSCNNWTCTCKNYVCVCVLVCTHVHRCTLTCGGYGSTLSVFLSFPTPYFLSQCFSVRWLLSELQDPMCFVPPTLGVQMFMSCPAFIEVLEI